MQVFSDALEAGHRRVLGGLLRDPWRGAVVLTLVSVSGVAQPALGRRLLWTACIEN